MALTDVAAKAEAAVVESICSERWESGLPSGLLCLVVLAADGHTRETALSSEGRSSGQLQTCGYAEAPSRESAEYSDCQRGTGGKSTGGAVTKAPGGPLPLESDPSMAGCAPPRLSSRSF